MSEDIFKNNFNILENKFLKYFLNNLDKNIWINVDETRVELDIR
jgi:hypothetical protein